MSFSSSFLFFLLFCFILRSPRRWLYTRSRFAAGLSAFFSCCFHIYPDGSSIELSFWRGTPSTIQLHQRERKKKRFQRKNRNNKRKEKEWFNVELAFELGSDVQWRLPVVLTKLSKIYHSCSATIYTDMYVCRYQHFFLFRLPLVHLQSYFWLASRGQVHTQLPFVLVFCCVCCIVIFLWVISFFFLRIKKKEQQTKRIVVCCT